MSVVFAVVASLTLLFLVVVLLRNPKNPAFWAFFLTGFLWVLILAGILFSLRWVIPFWGSFFLAAGVSWLPSQGTFFSFCFARENVRDLLRRWQWFLSSLFLLSLVFLGLSLPGQVYLLGTG